MENGSTNQHKETSLYIRENLVSPAEVETTSAGRQSEIKDKVLQSYLNYYSNTMENKKSVFGRISPKMRYTFLALTLVVLLGTAGIYFTNFNKSEKSESNKVADSIKAAITYQEGDVEVMLEDGRWVDLGEEDTLEEGDSFRVVGEGRGVLSLDDGSAVRLASNTTIKLTSMDPENIVITNESGEVYTRVEKLDRKFVVETADASYTSLGTAYKTVQKKDKKGVYVYESKVEVDPSKEKVIVEEGEKFFITDKKNEVKKITSEDVSDSFTKFNKERDLEEFGEQAATFTKLEKEKSSEEIKKEEVKTQENENTNPEPAPAPAQASISLGGHAEGNGIKLNWVPSNVDVSQGFKVVYSKTNSNPTFGVDDSIYMSDPGSRNAFVQKNDGQTYYFRVCRYTGGGCDTYSNTMTIQAPGNVQGVQTGVSSISLSQIAANKVGWSANGSAPQGFKIVWSKNSGPTYPTRAGDNAYYNSANGNSHQYLDPFSGAGTYFVRVCEYNGSGCGVYSNEISITLN